jgi:hypothetical protein
MELIVKADVGFTYFNNTSVDFLNNNVSQQFFLKLNVNFPSDALIWAFAGPSSATVARFEPRFASTHVNWSVCFSFFAIN